MYTLTKNKIEVKRTLTENKIEVKLTLSILFSVKAYISYY